LNSVNHAVALIHPPVQEKFVPVTAKQQDHATIDKPISVLNYFRPGLFSGPFFSIRIANRNLVHI